MKQLKEAKSPNDKVMGVLLKNTKPLTAYQILERLSKSGVTGPPTVYRALEKLIRDGQVHRIESLNAFIACRQDHAHHGDNFAVCKSCGDVTEIHEHKMENLINNWGKQNNFKIEREIVEIIGTCADCSEKA